MKKQAEPKPLAKWKPILLTIVYLAIFIALYLIYGTGDAQNNFIYNEF